jgi:hypothetical protein
MLSVTILPISGKCHPYLKHDAGTGKVAASRRAIALGTEAVVAAVARGCAAVLQARARGLTATVGDFGRRPTEPDLRAQGRVWRCVGSAYHSRTRMAYVFSSLSKSSSKPIA